jgi:hypothetical protein
MALDTQDGGATAFTKSTVADKGSKRQKDVQLIERRILVLVIYKTFTAYYGGFAK